MSDIDLKAERDSILNWGKANGTHNPVPVMPKRLFALLDRLEFSERSRNEAEKDLGEQSLRLNQAYTDLQIAERRAEEAEKEREALRKDAERLDFVDRVRPQVIRCFPRDTGAPSFMWGVSGHRSNSYANTIRTALDVAIAQDAGAEHAPKPAPRGIDAGVQGGARLPTPDEWTGPDKTDLDGYDAAMAQEGGK